jgi:Na+(H+)/acetate symporter ActP
VYVTVFPQLVLILYFERSNTYGSVVAFCVSLLLRILCQLKDLLKVPTYYPGGISTHGAIAPNKENILTVISLQQIHYLPK